jgi:four helix bundle protein
MEEYIPHFKFEKLLIWQKAMDFGEAIFNSSKTFPKDETFNLISQARRAADSIALNIAEGSISQSNPEFKKFINYAVRSLAEVVTCLHKAKRRGYIREDEFMVLYKDSFHLMNMIQSFKSKIK